MKVIKIEDVIYVLENHLNTPEAAGIIYELLDYIFIVADE